jgi:hypothetical protein
MWFETPEDAAAFQQVIEEQAKRALAPLPPWEQEAAEARLRGLFKPSSDETPALPAGGTP